MRSYLSLFTASAMVLGATAFSPNVRSSSVKSSPATSSTAVFSSFPDEKSSVGKMFEDLKSRVDFNSLSESASTMKDNAMVGNVGGRDELWTAGVAVLVACIVLGNIPVIGGVTSLVLGPGLFIGGLALLFVGVTDLGESFSPWPKPSEGAPLVTSGIYSKLRHPIYTGVVAALAGASVISDSASRLFLTGVLFYVIDLVSTKEEEYLQEQYPDQFGKYQNQVPGKYFPTDLVNDLTNGMKPKTEETK